MKITKFPKPLSKKYLRLAATYRRFVGKNSGYDFSIQALLDCHAYESLGGARRSIYGDKNGYIQGKRARDITVATWREDIRAGHFCKAEFYTICNRWWAVNALESIIPPPWFTFDLKTYITSSCSNPTYKNLLLEVEKIKLYR